MNLNITDATISNTVYNLLVTADNNCTGTVQLNKTLTITEKNTLVTKYGNIDSTSNSLHIIYNLNPDTEVTITGDNSISEGRTKSYVAVYNGNKRKYLSNNC